MSYTVKPVPCWLLTTILILAQHCPAEDQASQRPESSAPWSAQLSVQATVLRPDGSPAAGAIVRSYDVSDFSQQSGTADRLGKIELQDHFLNDVRLHALSQHGRSQAVLLNWGVDEHASEISAEIGGTGHGIPFHALMSPGGEILVTSEGPLGNIGMPGTIEGLRHFQTMLESARRSMSSAEVSELIESLRERN